MTIRTNNNLIAGTPDLSDYATKEDLTYIATRLPILTYQYTDHLLNDIQWLRAEPFSWQYGSVYEIAYDHLTDDLTTATLKEEYLKANVGFNGDVVESNGYLSGFNTFSYGTVNTSVDWQNVDWEMVWKFKSGADVSTSQNAFGCGTADYKGIIGYVTSSTYRLYASSNGSSWNIWSNAANFGVAANTTYWVKYTWDKTTLIAYWSYNGQDWTQFGTSTVGSPLNMEQINVGYRNIAYTGEYFRGTIDLNNCYIKVNGNYYWRGTDTYQYYLAKDGHKIMLPAQSDNLNYLYSKYSDGWYFLLDTTNDRFKLPRSSHGELVKSWQQGYSWYRLYADGWCEQGGRSIQLSGNQNIHLHIPYISSAYTVSLSMYGANSSDQNWSVVSQTAYDFYIHTTENYWGLWSTEGYTRETTDKHLYFYVGNFNKTAVEQTAGLNAELINSKVDKTDTVECAVVTETWNSGTNWYRIWSDGWCEQGGYLFTAVDANWRTVTQTLHIPYKDTNYYVGVHTGHTSYTNEPCVGAKSTTNFVCYPYNSSGNSNWHTAGYIR